MSAVVVWSAANPVVARSKKVPVVLPPLSPKTPALRGKVTTDISADLRCTITQNAITDITKFHVKANKSLTSKVVTGSGSATVLGKTVPAQPALGVRAINLDRTVTISGLQGSGTASVGGTVTLEDDTVVDYYGQTDCRRF